MTFQYLNHNYNGDNTTPFVTVTNHIALSYFPQKIKTNNTEQKVGMGFFEQKQKQITSEIFPQNKDLLTTLVG